MKKVRILTAIIGLSLLFAIPVTAYIHQKMNVNVATETTRLQKYKQKAIEQINEVDLSLYREDQALEITELISETTTKINNCETVEEVQSVVSSFNRYLLTIKTDEQLTREEEESEQESQSVYYISSYDDLLEFRDDVNSGYTYEGETVVLTEDITIPSSRPFNTPIGNLTTKVFSGTFDGKNHKIKGLKLSGETRGFIWFGTKCTVKNLVFEDVDITSTLQRASAVISRADNVTIENVHVLSGTITGPKQSGSLIGTAVGESGPSTIKNCSNNATISTTGDDSVCGGAVGLVYSGGLTIDGFTNTGTVSASKKSAGGFVGHVMAAGTTIVIKNSTNNGPVTGNGLGVSGGVGFSAGESLLIEDCSNTGNITNAGESTGGLFGFCNGLSKATLIKVKNSNNSGSISGQSNGTGGIVGSHNATSANITFIVEGCTNTGSVTGVNYVGGVAGLIRNSTTDSYVDNCFNYGDVTATSTNTPVGCGGIIGTARVNVDNCGCYIEATLSAKSVTKSAKELSAIGTPGFIALNYEANCKSHINNRLINLDGTDY